MKTCLVLSCFLFGFILTTCQKEKLDYPYEAKVIGRNIDCHIYAIKFYKDLEVVESILGYSNSIYIAYNLPEELQVNELEILLDFRKTRNNELGVCTCLGPSYNWLTVINAKRCKFQFNYIPPFQLKNISLDKDKKIIVVCC